MRTIAAVAILALLAALCLPLALAAPARTEETAPPSPDAAPTPAPAGADAETAFTVLTGGEARRVTMAEWLPGVLAGEMPALFEPEALKAQAVAARTYILSRMAAGHGAHPQADVCDDPACCKAHADEAALREKWGADFDAYWEKMRAAVRETDGEYLAWEGAPIQAVFHSSSAGRTEDAAAVWSALPYLVSVDSPETAADVPDYVTTVLCTPESFRETVLAAYPEADLSAEPALWLGEQSRTAGGRVESARIGGVDVPGTALRELFALRSAAFTLDYAEGSFLFVVTGYGHGVGMSQFGANVMAGGGADYREILAHYYPGAALTG